MADKNTYLKYKRDQRLLTYWIIHASNEIIKTLPSDEPVTANTTGEVSLATLKSLSKLIADHIKPIPITIFLLFQSIIEARKETHGFFQRIVASNPDPDIQKSNDSHKHWIDGLTDAFNALGGESWMSTQRVKPGVADEDQEKVIFSNAFSILSLDEKVTEDREEDEEDDSDDAEQATVVTKAVRLKKPSKKGKKGKRGQKSKKTKIAESIRSLDVTPLECYRIIGDETGTVSDYMMAVYSLAKQWIRLRHYLQGVWRQVAYDGLNSAVAAALSNIAIAMIKDTQNQIFVDFPEHDSFDVVTKTITLGDVNNAQGIFRVQVHNISVGGHSELAGKSDVDVKEEFMIHCYQDLVDFITDFQKTRSGKPTKSLLKEIRDWSPTFDLQQATEEQRLKWRRCYTINWLYDLVNVNSSVVTQRGQDIPLESVDWSVTGPWNAYRRLFGINEFAGDITHLAVQKPGTRFLPKILPHHVFQLQCIVDSMAVSRGWFINFLKGHSLLTPASQFRPRRDLDLFMDRQKQNPDAGFCSGIDVLLQCLQHDSILHDDPDRHKNTKWVLHKLQNDFVGWLGESKYMHGLPNISPSRFSTTNWNGLWEYSPFLCGAGLMEALELTYGAGLALWDHVHEPICIFHLYNMLVKKGYITEPGSLYAAFQVLFEDSFFAGGKAPTSDFQQAFQAQIGVSSSRRETFRQRAFRRLVAQAPSDFYSILDGSRNRFFKDKSLLQAYRMAGWVPDRIPDEQVPLPSALGSIRLSEVKQVIDPVTKQISLEDTELVKHARSIGMSDAMVMHTISDLLSKMICNEDSESLDSIRAKSSNRHTNRPLPEEASQTPSLNKHHIGVESYLEGLKLDLINDVYGLSPRSSVNYMSVLARFMLLFAQIEKELRSLRNSSWVEAYERNSSMARDKRLSFTGIALGGKDKECLQVIADAFQNRRAAFMDHVYWNDLEDHTTDNKTGIRYPHGPPEGCTVA
ncbi:hypothetical protein PHISCL_04590 [Aspergillus sclerotialis]|uniref:DUF6604 domain-containing protein n=1 Tax=Aspergillus sclerotialis TaxID=2070753 RepID=A0A3A3A161_9EURO|nr:hypothetical protein PHISCL_04590 [Aspergillus sclerotialis]